MPTGSPTFCVESDDAWVQAVLESSRGGLTLAPGVAAAMAKVMTEHEGLTLELFWAGIEVLEDVIALVEKENGKPLGVFIKRGIVEWYKAEPKKPTTAPAKSRLDHLGEGEISRLCAVLGFDEAGTEAGTTAKPIGGGGSTGDACLGGDVDASGFDGKGGGGLADAPLALSDEAASDLKVQGAKDVKELAKLSMALVIGRVPTAIEFAGMTYGCDPRTTKAFKETRKGGVPTLYDLLRDPKGMGQFMGLSDFFGDTAEKLSGSGLPHLAQRVLKWWNDTSKHFRSAEEHSMLCSYIVEYLRAYSGRGLPVLISMDIMMRVRFSASSLGLEAVGKGGTPRGGTSGGGSSSEDPELKKKLASLENTVKQLKDENGRLKRNAVREPTDPKGKKKIRCFACGETGHVARDCPNVEAAAEDDE